MMAQPHLMTPGHIPSRIADRLIAGYLTGTVARTGGMTLP
jgi:hypothetical protein